MEFWATLLGSAAGVVAGVFIQYGLQWLVDSQTTKSQKQGLKRELEYNRAVLSELRHEATNFRNAVNGHVFRDYLGYFAFSRAFFAQAGALMNAGTLYKWFEVKDLKKLQRVNFILSSHNETWSNNEITRFKNFNDEELKANQTTLVRLVDFVATQIEEADANIVQLMTSLD
jgi:hypothetical protein